MVLSIETTLMHPRRGFVKLEDTVAVTETGRTPSVTKAGTGTAVWPQPEASEMVDRSLSSRPKRC
jgi:Xaa-Pro aminopeptidase